ncbi:MAG: glycosyltransferase family 39 protein [Paludibacteraceae bacterium]|nr:glycosyltransferase family 39 protein [Paludibacteraceae bacterium]
MALIILLSIYYFSNYAYIFDKKIDLNGDNVQYYSLGKSLAEGNGYTSTIGFKNEPHTHFPPGYPVFIAGIMKIFPNSTDAVKLFNGLLLYGSILLLFYIIKRISGNIIVAFITGMLCAAHPELLRWATIMMSEILYLFLSLLLVLLVLEITRRKLFLDKKWLEYGIPIALIMLLNYTYFVRTMGLSIIISIILWVGIRFFRSLLVWYKAKRKEETDEIATKKARMVKLFVLTLLLLLSVSISKFSWDTRNERLGVHGSVYAENFSKKQFGQTMSTPQDWEVRIESNVKNYITRWVPNTLFYSNVDLGKDVTATEWLRGLFVLALMLTGIWFLKDARWLILFYMAITMAVLIFYPEQFGGSRYYIALIPFFIFLTIYGFSQLVALVWQQFQKKQKSVIVISLLVIVFPMIFMFPTYAKMRDSLHLSSQMDSWEEFPEVKAVQYLQAIDWCKANLPANSRVMCRKPELYYIFSGYRRAECFPLYASPDSVLNFFIRKKVTHVIIDGWFRHGYITIYPAVLKYPDKFKMLKKIGEFNVKEKLNPTYIVEFNPKWGFSGKTVNGKSEGKGEVNYQDGRRFVGNFANDLPNGYGEYFDSHGKTLAKGFWKNGQLIKKIP